MHRLDSCARAALALAGALLVWSAPVGATTLRQAAGAAGIFVGAAFSSFEVGTATGALLVREFSSLTPENETKWSELSPAPGVFDFARADSLFAFAEANGLRVRGHTLVWGRPNGPPAWLPAELAAAADPAERLRELMLDQIAAVAGRYAGRAASWDVVNEPLAFGSGALDPANPYFELLGEGFVAEAFRAARAADPAARLYLNEVNVEAVPAKFLGLLDLVARLRADGVPIDGVGLQGHFLTRPDRSRLVAQLEALAALGVEVEITELDLPLLLFSTAADPLAAQAQAFADVFSACLAVSACRGVTTWGTNDGDTWLDGQPFFSYFAPNRPLLFDAELAPKPARDAVVATLVAVPEAGTLALLASGAALLAAVRSSRR